MHAGVRQGRLKSLSEGFVSHPRVAREGVVPDQWSGAPILFPSAGENPNPAPFPVH